MVGKIEWRGPGTLVVNIIVNYNCYTRVLLYAKELIGAETEETNSFFVTFLSLVSFQLEGIRSSPDYAYGPPKHYRVPLLLLKLITIYILAENLS